MNVLKTKNKNSINLISNEGEIIQTDSNNYCKIMNKKNLMIC